MKNTSIELGRCVAALAVIVIHCSGSYLGDMNNDAWISAEILNAASRFAVPFFFMASGAFVLGKEVADGAAYIRKRAARILVPYLIGSIFYLAWSYWYQGARPLPFDWFVDFLRGASWFHLWFLPVMFAVSILAVFGQNITKKNANSLRIIVSFLLFTSALNQMLEIAGFTLGLFLASSVYFQYFLCGWVLARSTKPGLFVSGLIFFCCTFAIAAASMISKQSGNPQWSTAFDSYASPFVILQSISFYWIITSVKLSDRVGIWSLSVSQLTLGIYVFHHAVMVMLIDFFAQKIGFDQNAILMIVPISTFLLCAIGTRAIKTVPVLRNWI
ncbi:acyltransferase family protein [Agrobacterium tumefaciens]|uniref:acyltransferase n=1 Tax=Agrobacterium tumefaciens TaxID=358 RepID=UPI00157475D7|nr:acyltransferase family protein [Agrobacterium tumefaciens]